MLFHIKSKEKLGDWKVVFSLRDCGALRSSDVIGVGTGFDYTPIHASVDGLLKCCGLGASPWKWGFLSFLTQGGHRILYIKLEGTLGGYLAQSSHFIDEEIEAHRSYVTCSRDLIMP